MNNYCDIKIYKREIYKNKNSLKIQQLKKRVSINWLEVET